MTRRNAPFEVAVALVGPVELHVAARDPAGFDEGAAIFRRDEEPVDRRKAARFGEILDLVDQRGAHLRCVGTGADQQTWGTRGCERNADHELGVIREPVLCVGLCPGEIEHELAERVRLHVRRRGGKKPVFVVQRDGRGIPARAVAYAAGFLERSQERMTQERRAACIECVPGGGINVRDAGRGTCPHRAQPCNRILPK